MSVYIDRLRDFGWAHGPSCHLIADTEEDLHQFAKQIGLKREWFQTGGSCSHYDLTAKRREGALRAGAIPLDDYHFLAIVRRLRAERNVGKSPDGEKFGEW